MAFAEEAREVGGQGVDELRPFGGLRAFEPVQVFPEGLDAQAAEPLGQPRLHHGELVGGQGDARMGVQEIAEGAEGGSGKRRQLQPRDPSLDESGGSCPDRAAPASSRMRPGTSRIRATRPSPRMVAPEIPSTRL